MPDRDKASTPTPSGETVPPTGTPVGNAPAPPSPVAEERYQIEGFLGEGGMGTVYKARHLGLQRTVALKVIRPDVMTAELRGRFKIEAEAVASLDHPHIIKVFDFGDNVALPGLPLSPHLALEYVPGGSLAKALEEGKLRGPNGVMESAQLIAILARAMHHAHERGIVHRDLKPDNVLCAERSDVLALNTVVGVPKITDFGLARKTSADQRLTQTGVILGTPQYLAPEQAEGKKDVGPAADSWALGVILYECLTGQVPFRFGSIPRLLYAICYEEPAPVQQLRDVPTELARVCMDCLAKEPDQRPTAKELWHRLARFLKGSVRQAAVEVVEKEITNSLGMKLVLIPAGSFHMGSDDAEADEDQKPAHDVTLTKAFYLGTHEVTQKQFHEVMGYNPSYFSKAGRGLDRGPYTNKPAGGHDRVPPNTDDFPVENVSQEEVREFCRRLSDREAEKKAGRTYRLPTEAEWEYACRAGTTTKYHFGDTIDGKLANYLGSAVNRTTKVGSYEPNAFGLYDMHGNVWEWCSDSLRTYAAEGSKDPCGGQVGHHALRGGSWSSFARFCRAASRDGLPSGHRGNYIGFRVALTALVTA